MSDEHVEINHSFQLQPDPTPKTEPQGEANSQPDEQINAILDDFGISDGRDPVWWPEDIEKFKAALKRLLVRERLDEVNRHLLHTGLSAYSRKVLHDREDELRAALEAEGREA